MPRNDRGEKKRAAKAQKPEPKSEPNQAPMQSEQVKGGIDVDDPEAAPPEAPTPTKKKFTKGSRPSSGIFGIISSFLKL